MTPESPCARAFVASPNHDARAGGVDILLLNYTGMADTAAAQARLCDPAAKVSCHYLVHEDGGTVQLVPEARRAWHAGAAVWQGTTDINSRAIGIEIANGGHDFGCPDYPPAQIAAVIRLCRDILARHPIPPHNMLAHSDVAPRRKRDPGETFPWDKLHDAGIGLWVAPAPLSAGRILAPGDRGAEVARLKRRCAITATASRPPPISSTTRCRTWWRRSSATSSAARRRPRRSLDGADAARPARRENGTPGALLPHRETAMRGRQGSALISLAKAAGSGELDRSRPSAAGDRVATISSSRPPTHLRRSRRRAGDQRRC